MYESPLQPDDPFAMFRIQCGVCRQNVWAAQEPPPGEGDDILAAHECPGPADVAAESQVVSPVPPAPAGPTPDDEESPARMLRRLSNTEHTAPDSNAVHPAPPIGLVPLQPRTT